MIICNSDEFGHATMAIIVFNNLILKCSQINCKCELVPYN